MCVHCLLRVVLAVALVTVCNTSVFAQPYAYVDGRVSDGYALYLVDAKTGQVVSRLSVAMPPIGPWITFKDHVVSPGGRWMFVNYVSYTGNAIIRRIELATGVVDTFASGYTSWAYPALALSPDGTRLYALKESPNRLLIFETSTNTQIGSTTLDPWAVTNQSPNIAVSPSTGRVYVAESGGVTVLDETTYARVGRIDLTGTPLYLAVTPDDAHLHASMGSPTIVDIDTATASCPPIPGNAPTTDRVATSITTISELGNGT